MLVIFDRPRPSPIGEYQFVWCDDVKFTDETQENIAMIGDTILLGREYNVDAVYLDDSLRPTEKGRKDLTINL